MNRSSSTEEDAYQQERAGAKAQKVKGTTSSQDGKSLGGAWGPGKCEEIGKVDHKETGGGGRGTRLGASSC